jgi:hypothetical protein
MNVKAKDELKREGIFLYGFQTVLNFQSVRVRRLAFQILSQNSGRRVLIVPML